jgi:hypothetical protein
LRRSFWNAAHPTPTTRESDRIDEILRRLDAIELHLTGSEGALAERENV